MRKIGLLGCVKKKQKAKAKGKDLYTSPYFQKGREYVERCYDSWYILSAKYHLVDPEIVLEPYEETLKDKSAVERKRWAEVVFQQIQKQIDSKSCKLYIHAGKDYFEYLLPLLGRAGYDCELPMEGLGIGSQMAWYDAHNVEKTCHYDELRHEKEIRVLTVPRHIGREEGGNMPGIKVADETWIGCALLHHENPDRGDFSAKEIVMRVAQENIHGELRPGIQWHANLHCVANKVPNPGNYRMLYETHKGRRRLFSDGDSYHPLREGKKTKPSPSEIPQKYHYLLKWYDEVYNKISKAGKVELTTPEKQEQEEKLREAEVEPLRITGDAERDVARNVFRSYCTEKMAAILNKSMRVKWVTEGTIHGTSRIDLVGEDEETTYLLELELRREDPVNNVTKIYRMIEEGLKGHMPSKIFFIHIFSGFYKTRSTKRDNAEFAGKKMAEALKNVEYKIFQWELVPPVVGEDFPGDTDEQIHALCDAILGLVVCK